MPTKSSYKPKPTVKHGHCPYGHPTKTWNSWSKMRSRCLNPNHDQFSDYGGRGIVICDQWNNFECFLKDMGERPPNMTLNRIDNDGPYCKDNCNWETRAAQARNRRSNVIITVRGITGCIKQVAEHFGINYDLARDRIFNGWNPEDAFFTPPILKGHHKAC